MWTIPSLVHWLGHWLEVQRRVRHKHWLRWSDIITVFSKFRWMSYRSVRGKYSSCWTCQMQTIIFRNLVRKSWHKLILPWLATWKLRNWIVSSGHWIIRIENLFFLKLKFGLIHSWPADFLKIIRHIHCLVKSLFLWFLVHFTKLRFHKDFSSHTHGCFTIIRHSDRILTFFLGVPDNSRDDNRNFRCLSWQYRFYLLSSWCRKDSLRWKWKGNALMQTWFKFKLISHFSNEHWSIGNLRWS